MTLENPFESHSIDIMQSKCGHVKLIYITAKTAQPFIHAHAVIQMPFTHQQLLETIHSLLGSNVTQ